LVNNEIIKGTETILLVDDESVVIDVGKEMLEKVGIRCTYGEKRQRCGSKSSAKNQSELI
jgi:CheY-like chemotaxis protein